MQYRVKIMANDESKVEFLDASSPNDATKRALMRCMEEFEPGLDGKAKIEVISVTLDNQGDR